MTIRSTIKRISRISTSLFFLLFILSNTSFAQSPEQILLSQLDQASKLTIDDLIVTDDYTSKGIRHIYAKRSIAELEIYNSYAAIHLINGKNIRVDNTLHPFLSYSDITNRILLDPKSILIKMANRYSVESQSIRIISSTSEPNKNTILNAPSIAFNEVNVELKLYLLNKDDLRYVWSVEIDEKQSGNWKNYFIDTETGDVLYEDNWTVECNLGHEGHSHHEHNTKNSSSVNAALLMMTDSSYNVFAYPIESPNHGSRSYEEKPWLDNLLASPNGWHQINGTEYTVTRGNNVDAYLDDDSSNSPTNGDAARADGGVNLEFDFAWDEDTPPGDLPLPAITNLFYWNNIIHDMWYNSGFDEASGNFQEENNNGMGGLEGDYVRAEAQDGAGTCNANMATPPDGSRPRMQMFLCNSRDGDLDNAVIAHEYGHGISNRLTGGPAASGCLGNQEQMGEGWSDWFGLMMTIEVGDTETDNRPIGTYLFGQPIDGAGIRPYPYTTDMAVNPMTYASSFSGVSVPHGLGSVWCTMLWDMTWMMVDEYGFDSDLYDGTGGNNMAMELVIEALKLQPCSPGFVDGRDAIIAADEAINGGANVCMIWEVFANRGLGYSALQGSSSNRSDGTEAFDLPPTCTLDLIKIADVSQVSAGSSIEYTLTSTNYHVADQTSLVVTDSIPDNTMFVSADNGGSESGGLVSWDPVSLDIDQVITYSFIVSVDNDIDPVVDDVFDDMENGTLNWALSSSGSTSWILQSTTTASGNNTWFANDGSSPGGASLQYAFNLGMGNNSQLTFTHWYDTEATWDGGVVEISVDNGKTWNDLGDNFIANGYNSLIFNSRPGFSGNSGGFITSEIDLSDYDGQVGIVKFEMNCDAAVGGNGWFIDDVFIENLNRYIPNIATSITDQFEATGVLDFPTKVLIGPNDFVVSGSSTDVQCLGNDGTAMVTPSGGSGSYTYLWSTGEETISISNLSSGTYFVDVDDGSLTRRKYFFITGPQALVADVSTQNALGGANGSAIATPSEGLAPYSYLWSTGADTESISGLAAGTYELTVTDSNLCEDDIMFTIIDPVEECLDRSFLIEVQLDQYPEQVSYEISDDEGNIVASMSFVGYSNGAYFTDVICLPDDCYTLTVSDSFGDGLCASYSTPQGYIIFKDFVSDVILFDECDFTIVTKDFCVGPLSAEVVGIYPSCPEVADGIITVVPSAGEYAYTYNWSNGANTASVDNLLAGDYQVTVSDGLDQLILDYTLINGNSIVFTASNEGLGSLRAAATNGCSMDTISFDLGLIGDTIYLTSEILIDKTVHIEGMTIFSTYISGNDQNIIFQVAANGVLSIESMRLLDGNAASNGGAIYNQGQVILKDLVLETNTENGIPRAISGEGSVLIKGDVKIE